MRTYFADENGAELDPCPETPPAVRINRRNGSFSTNYLQLSVFRALYWVPDVPDLDARARAQDELGWHLEATATRLPAGGASLLVTLADAAGKPVQGRVLQARLERPTDKRLDLRADLLEASAGTYRAEVSPVSPGQWDLVVEVIGEGGVAFRRRHRIVLN